jgi:phytoene/squalene synthetase
MVIQQLPDHLRISVCVFYLVLRGLDTVEDDMVVRKPQTINSNTYKTMYGLCRRLRVVRQRS